MKHMKYMKHTYDMRNPRSSYCYCRQIVGSSENEISRLQHRGAPLYGRWYNNVNSNKPLSFQVCSIIVPCSGQTTCADMLERVYFTEKSPTNQGIPKWLDMVMMVFRPGWLNPGSTTYYLIFFISKIWGKMISCGLCDRIRGNCLRCSKSVLCSNILRKRECLTTIY